MTRFKKSDFVSYDECKRVIRELNIKSSNEWAKWCKINPKPQGVPSEPHKFYKNEWEGWETFLGVFNKFSNKKLFLSYKEAKEYIRKLSFRSKLDWDKWCKQNKRPTFMPSLPDSTYKNEWEGWSEFLGYRGKCSYGEACMANFMEQNNIEYKHQVKLEGCKDKTYLPFDIGVYKDGKLLALFEFHGQQHYTPVDKWGGNQIFETTQKHDNIKEMYCCKNNILLFVLSYEYFDKLYEWLKIYFEDYLFEYFPGKEYIIPTGMNTKAFQIWFSYEEAKAYIHQKGFKNIKEFRFWVRSHKRHPRIPIDPEATYRHDGWEGYGDFLGTGAIATFNRHYISYQNCKELAQSLNIKSHYEWRKFVKQSNRNNLPLYPDATYKTEFEGYDVFLSKPQFLPFKEARDYVIKLNISSKTAWFEWIKNNNLPDNIPRDPYCVYNKIGTWTNWKDFLGNNKSPE